MLVQELNPAGETLGDSKNCFSIAKKIPPRNSPNSILFVYTVTCARRFLEPPLIIHLYVLDSSVVPGTYLISSIWPKKDPLGTGSSFQHACDELIILIRGLRSYLNIVTSSLCLVSPWLGLGFPHEIFSLIDFLIKGLMMPIFVLRGI